MDGDTNSENPKLREIKGRIFYLDENRHVFVGQTEPDDEKTYLQFKNGDLITNINLSSEATNALYGLLGRKICNVSNVIDELVNEISYKLKELPETIELETKIKWVKVEKEKTDVNSG